MSTFLPRLALTIGDCAGIGPELALRAMSNPEISATCRLLVYGNLTLMQRVAEAADLGLPPELAVIHHERWPSDNLPTTGPILIDTPFTEASTLHPGAVSPACGLRAFEWISMAVRDIRAGIADALVTAPINKAALHSAGVPFPGHTEMLADLCGSTEPPCMAFYAPDMFVSLATIHEPVAKVSGLLETAALQRIITLTAEACERLSGNRPRVGVLALNPHAGENGLFGSEEQDVIIPAIRAAQQAGVDAVGPLVPDTAFTWLFSGELKPFDAYVAMYHDQGLIPFKMKAFDTGVNVTLGLPVIRTSPDHGTAFDLAWRGQASPASLFSAIRLAVRLTKERLNQPGFC